MIAPLIDRFKLFGAAVDAADDPWTLQLKHAAIYAQENGMQDINPDPLAALLPLMPRQLPKVIYGDRFSTPPWLRPIPPPSVKDQIIQEKMTRFVAEGGMWQLAQQVKDYVTAEIFPQRPLMLGIDHAMTGGVLMALSEKIGPKNLSVVILDQHFDGLPLSLRVDTAMLPAGRACGQTEDAASALDDDAYCCGNFFKQLMDDGILLPWNLIFIGVADYPEEHAPPGGERYKENYEALEKRGCRFFPATRFRGDFQNDLANFIAGSITTPYLYISLDMDVGAHQCVHAARYMDTVGISREAIEITGRILAAGCRKGDYHLAGMDVMEFNMHFLGLQYEPGKYDATLEVAADFIMEMLAV